MSTPETAELRIIQIADVSGPTIRNGYGARIPLSEKWRVTACNDDVTMVVDMDERPVPGGIIAVTFRVETIPKGTPP